MAGSISIDPERRAALLQVKLRTLVREAFDGPADANPSTFTGGAALQHGDQAWVLADDRPEHAVGRALAWARGRDIATLHVLVDDHAGTLTRRASQFANPPAVWWVQGREVHQVEPAPFETPAAPPMAALDLVSVLAGAGAEVVVEHGVVRGEVLGLEIATVVVDGDGTARIEVGVGRHDREAFGIIHGDLPTADAVAAVISEVRLRRRPDARDHPLKRLEPERWLRELVIARPSMVGASTLERVEGPVPRQSVKDAMPAFAVGPGVVVASSVGIDLDLVPAAADARLAHATPDTRLVIVVPERDGHPVTRELAAALKVPAEIVTVPDDWRAGLPTTQPHHPPS